MTRSDGDNFEISSSIRGITRHRFRSHRASPALICTGATHFAGMSAAQSASQGCVSPAWHSVFQLDPSAGCPGDWVQILPQPGAVDATTPPVPVCSRGYVRDVSQASAILAQGWVYNAVRGQVSAQAMGSPDSMRSEPLRGQSTIDDAYLDGVSLTRWTPHGREHIASYAAGLSYTARHFSYYQLGNCVCESLATSRTTHANIRTRDPGTSVVLAPLSHTVHRSITSPVHVRSRRE